MASLASNFGITPFLAQAIIKEYKDGKAKLASRLLKEQRKNAKLELVKRTIQELIESKQ